ncbi:hypothetical protein G7043_02895 [Lentzea sp. NEAU-D13]|uniref:non-specific serine/threonine protein kinase n=1 Tax=Lentzea alba TaxID=2714351 RepID=A0A7C9VQ12_9PSEU|nr:hypothetical protein [Lentzea alba]
MGVVWRARDELLHREVAIKQLLLPDLQPSQVEEACRRAMREGRIAARLQHPNAIGVFDVVIEDGKPCLVTEYLPSRSLSDTAGARHAPGLGSRVPARRADGRPVLEAVRGGGGLRRAPDQQHRAGRPEVRRRVRPHAARAGRPRTRRLDRGFPDGSRGPRRQAAHRQLARSGPMSCKSLQV